MVVLSPLSVTVGVIVLVSRLLSLELQVAKIVVDGASVVVIIPDLIDLGGHCCIA